MSTIIRWLWRWFCVSDCDGDCDCVGDCGGEEDKARLICVNCIKRGKFTLILAKSPNFHLDDDDYCHEKFGKKYSSILNSFTFTLAKLHNFISCASTPTFQTVSNILGHFHFHQICLYHFLINFGPYSNLNFRRNIFPIFLFGITLMDILRHFHSRVKAFAKPISSTNFILNWSRGTASLSFWVIFWWPGRYVTLISHQSLGYL